VLVQHCTSTRTVQGTWVGWSLNSLSSSKTNTPLPRHDPVSVPALPQLSNRKAMTVYQKLPTSEGESGSAPIRTPRLARLASVLRALFHTLGLILLAFVLSVFLLGGLPAFEALRDPGLQVEKSFRREPSDYVLDNGWDVHSTPTTRSYNWTISEIEAAPDGTPFSTAPSITPENKLFSRIPHEP